MTRRLLIVAGRRSGWALDARAVKQVEYGHHPSGERTLDVMEALGLEADEQGRACTLTVTSPLGLLAVHMRGTARIAEVPEGDLLPVPSELGASRLIRASRAILLPEDGAAVFVFDPERLHQLGRPGAGP